jgi:hypothetical protein
MPYLNQGNMVELNFSRDQSIIVYDVRTEIMIKHADALIK